MPHHHLRRRRCRRVLLPAARGPKPRTISAIGEACGENPLARAKRRDSP
jgi:hypothetical protein